MHSNPVVNGLLSGAVAALAAAILHILFLQPILLRAEDYETGVRVHSFVAVAGHDDVTAEVDGSPAKEHSAVPTRFDIPVDLERNAQTVGFFLLTYAAFGLLLAAGVDVARRRGYVPSAGHAALWGAAGFAAFSLVPSFGMAPEPPGLAAGDLVLRQIWWIGCSGITLGTIAAIAFSPSRALWGTIGVIALVALMFVVPEPDALTGSVPPEIVGIFATRAVGISAAAWLVLSLCVLLRGPKSTPTPAHAL